MEGDKKSATTQSEHNLTSLAYFFVLGFGPNWVFANALLYQIPYFEENSPEELRVAAYMNLATSASIVSLIAFMLYSNRYGPPPLEYSVPSLLTFACLSAFLSVGIYDVLIDNTSVFLFLCCFFAGTVGALSSVVITPFLSQHENVYITASRSGGSFLILLCALISIAQNPGSPNIRFSPRIYFIIFAILLILPPIAYQCIIRNGLGLKRELTGSSGKGHGAEAGGVNVELAEVGNPLSKSLTDGENGKAKDNDRPSAYVLKSSSSSFLSHRSEGSGKIQLQTSPNSSSSIKGRITLWLDANLRSLVLFLAPCFPAYSSPWIEQVLPYMMAVSFLQFHTWGIMTAIIPYAMEYSEYNGDASVNLAIALQIGAVALLIGDLSTTLFALPIRESMAVFTIFTTVIYTAALKSSDFDNAGAAPILIILFTVTRYIEAHLVTLIYRTIATELAIEYQEDASRMIGMCDQFSTTIGAIISTVAVAFGA